MGADPAVFALAVFDPGVGTSTLIASGFNGTNFWSSGTWQPMGLPVELTGSGTCCDGLTYSTLAETFTSFLSWDADGSGPVRPILFGAGTAFFYIRCYEEIPPPGCQLWVTDIQAELARFDGSQFVPTLDGVCGPLHAYAPNGSGTSPYVFVAATLGPPYLVACSTFLGCAADYNHDGAAGTDQDIEDFFACLAGHCCQTCGGADFDGDGAVGTDEDIESFFRVLAGGAC
jgi:hypothetical protein